MMLPSDLWAQAAASPASGKVAPRFTDLPDTFKEDWVPPAPVLSARDITLNKAAPVSAPVLDLPQGKVLSQTDIANAKVFSTPLRATQRKQAGEP
ncbi:hypothetical protein, partial [Verrucomicrobium sp. BvORR106]|uniref:hypothetical protein n=1 Tax=Verrucomicrobium sp. BvORR106 TaxID=1403819 RepID=UPI002240F377